MIGPRRKLLAILALSVSVTVIGPSVSSSAPPPRRLYLPVGPSQARLSPIVVYAGPSSTAFGAGTEPDGRSVVTAVGQYGDFVKVRWAEADGRQREGFVSRASLATPGVLPQLSTSEVPWPSKLDLSKEVLVYRITVNGDRFVVDNTAANDYFGYELGPTPLSQPVRFDIDLSASSGPYAALSISGSIQPPEGPWWKGIHRVYVAYGNNYLSLEFRDGVSEASLAIVPLTGVVAAKPFSLTFTDTRGTQVVVRDSAGVVRQTISVPDLRGVAFPNGVFPDSNLYVGVLLARGSKLDTRLSITEAPTGVYVDPAAVDASLKQLGASRGVEIGSLAGLWDVKDLRYSERMRRDYSLQLVDIGWMWGLRPDRSTFNFSTLDQEVDYARRNAMAFRGNQLAAYWDQIPNWLKSGGFSRDELITVLQHHILTVTSRYRGQGLQWTVVNEPCNGSYARSGDIWCNGIGPEYIEMAFRWAREGDPTAHLILNETDNERLDPRSDRFYALTYDLLQKGVPVDSVGMQMHLNIKAPPRKQDVLSNMKRFAALGVGIHITELDVNVCDGVPGVTADQLQRQATVYGEMLEACLESGACRSFGTWGLVDYRSWLLRPEIQAQLGCAEAPLMYDDNYNPKPAYHAVRDALQRTSRR